jgi:hypothetical protein
MSRYERISTSLRMTLVPNDFSQREQFGTDRQAGSLDRIHVDCEPQFAIFWEELNPAAALGKTLALSDQERTGSLEAAYYLGEMLVLYVTNEDKLT